MTNKNMTVRTLIDTLLILFFLMTIQFSYAQEGTDHPIVGTWVFDHATSFSTVAPELQVQMDSIPQMKTSFESAFIGRTAHFDSTGNYTIALVDGRSVTCQWSINAEGVLQITDTAGNITPHELIFLDGTRLVMAPIMINGSTNVLPEQHYIKL